MRLLSRLCTRHYANVLEYAPTNHSSSRLKLNYYRIVENVLDVKPSISIADWVELKKLLPFPGFGYNACVALLVKDKGLSEARKLFAALEESEALNLVLKSQMMPAFEVYAADCTDKDFKFILDTVDGILDKFPVLTVEVIDDLLKGLTPTPFWKEKGKIVISRGIDKEHTSSLLNFAYAAFVHKDYEFAWQLIERAVPDILNLTPKLFHQIIDTHELCPEGNHLFKLLDILEKYSFMLPLGAAKQIDSYFNKSKSWVSRFSLVDPSGKCGCCRRQLRKVLLSEEEHEDLLKNVKTRFDLNNKLNSYEKEEFENFKQFLKKCQPYSAVIDGPNFFYRVNDLNKLSILVKSLEKRGHKILAICREHMQVNWKFTKQLEGHLVYYVKDRSKDDTYTIYAALSSGPGTLVVSNDFYGTYYSEMPSSSRKPFRKWQLSNQVVGLGYQAANMVFPEFTPVYQKSEDGSCIHVPLVTDEAPDAFGPSGWLCIQRVSKQEKKKALQLWPVKEFALETVDKELDAFRTHYKRIKMGAQKNNTKRFIGQDRRKFASNHYQAKTHKSKAYTDTDWTSFL